MESISIGKFAKRAGSGASTIQKMDKEGSPKSIQASEDMNTVFTNRLPGQRSMKNETTDWQVKHNANSSENKTEANKRTRDFVLEICGSCKMGL